PGPERPPAPRRTTGAGRLGWPGVTDLGRRRLSATPARRGRRLRALRRCDTGDRRLRISSPLDHGPARLLHGLATAGSPGSPRLVATSPPAHSALSWPRLEPATRGEVYEL